MLFWVISAKIDVFNQYFNIEVGGENRRQGQGKFVFLEVFCQHKQLKLINKKAPRKFLSGGLRNF